MMLTHILEAGVEPPKRGKDPDERAGSDIRLTINKTIDAGQLPHRHCCKGLKKFDGYGHRRGWKKESCHKKEPGPTPVYENGACIPDRRNE